MYEYAGRHIVVIKAVEQDARSKKQEARSSLRGDSSNHQKDNVKKGNEIAGGKPWSRMTPAAQTLHN